MRPRWHAQAGYAATPGGALVRTPRGESWIGGRDVHRLLVRLRPHLDGRTPLAEIVRPLGPERARAVAGLVAHLARIGAVEDAAAPPAADAAPRTLRAAVLDDPGRASALERCPAVLTFHDAPDRRRERREREWAAARRLAWLPVRVDLNEVWMGPLTGRWAGCPTCLDLRRRAVHAHGHARERIGREVAGRGAPNPLAGDARLARAVLELAAAWDPADRRAVARLPVAGGPPEWSAVLPVPGCPVCGGEPSPREGGPPPDLEEDLAVLGARLDRLAACRRTGVVGAALSRPDESLDVAPVGRAWAPAQDLVRGRRVVAEWSLGSGDTPAEARTVAILEALERYAAVRPRGQELRCATGEELGDDAIDPRRLVLHSYAQYARPGFACAPYDPRDRRAWVWAESLGSGRRVAVPADLAFYGMRQASAPGAPAVRPLAYQTSSGCAIGGSAAGAALRALLEALERDALLAAWYGGRPLCRLRAESAADPRTRRLWEALRAEGYECAVLDVTRPDVAVPAVWAVAVRRDDLGLKALSGACAHPVGEHAVLGAVREVVSHLRLAQRHYDVERRRSDRLVADPTLVRRPSDHGLVYANPRAFGRLERLFGPVSPRPLAEHFPGDGVAGLDGICRRLVASGSDVLLADVTPADVRELGLRVVRALVPGALPVTFGHGHERLTGARLAFGEDVETLWPHPLA
jgi:ribosomal protein S12 methylthiotransferase accessory factor